MQNLVIGNERRTTTDMVFERLHEEINSLKLPPGARVSEVEIAQRFGVSRQPVRDAFYRLGNLDLLLIRPQKATIVRGFLEESIVTARFIRLAVELEVMNRACKVWTKAHTKSLSYNLDQQITAVKAEQWDDFHKLDSEFHALICKISDTEHAIETIKNCRQKTDRICALGLNREKEVDLILADHRKLIDALDQKDVPTALEVTRQHLGRIDPIIEDIRNSHADYFDNSSHN